MLNGIIGRKKGMAQVFADDGRVVPVTIVAISPCKVVQVKTMETDGYTALQIAAE